MGGNKRCALCGKKKTCFRYDGMDVCGGCKGNLQSCDNHNGKADAPKKEVKPAVSRARAQSEAMMKAKRR